MKIPLSFAELHTPLFLGVTNLQTKLDTKRRPLSLLYDREQQELVVIFNGRAAIIPAAGVASMEPINPEVAGITIVTAHLYKPAPAPKSGKPIKAQVEVPHEKVQNPPMSRSVPGR